MDTKRGISYIPQCTALYHIINLSDPPDQVSLNMDAVEEQPWQAEVFCKCNLLYLYCVDLSYNFAFTIPSLPFLKLNGVFGHGSFPGSQAERQMVVLPRSDKVLAKLKDVVSPCVTEVKSSVSFKVNTNTVLLFRRAPLATISTI